MTEEAKTTSPPVAVVSGGSSGIGKAFVAALRARGYAVVTCGRDAQKLSQLILLCHKLWLKFRRLETV
ncbi:MAG TPA: SDR family NAD(P)-dependent oxidoreductase [Roseiarcus sp.]|nr:SDR family NAD(P)-dependent oxidoreductase [Roseiarcus sp.]